MKPTDIAKSTSVGDPRLSPDGRQVAYVLSRIDSASNRYTSQIWVAATDGGSAPRPLTSGEHRDSQPRWSPDGSQIAFTSSRKTDEKGRTRSTLHLLPFDRSGETVLLASGDEPFSEPAFSPDGTMLAVAHRVRGAHYDEDEVGSRPARQIEVLFSKMNGEGFIFDRPLHVHVVPIDGSGPLRDVTPGPHEYSMPAWLPDNERLAAHVNRFPKDFAAEIAIIDASPDPDLEAVSPRFLTDSGGWYGMPSVTADGARVLVLGSDDADVLPQNYHIGRLDIDVAQPTTPTWLSRATDRNWAPIMCGSLPALLSDGSLLASIEDRGNGPLLRLDPDTGNTETIVEGELSITGFDHFEADRGLIVAYTATTATSPSELYVLDGDDQRQLTHHSRAFVAAIRPRQPEHFLVQSGDVEVDAWIVTPHDFDPAKTYPALLNIHGGPFTQYGNFFFDEVQLQAQAGYVVIYSNPRGGSGRTDAWGQAIAGPKHKKVPGSGWGGLDYDDLMAVVDTAVERFGYIDAERLGVLGGSYGGYMTTWIVTHTNRFAASCSERSVNNLETLEHSSDIAGFFISEIGVDAVTDAEEYRRMSPIHSIDKLETPLLIIHSEDDLRCPEDQAWQLFNACLQLEKPDVEFWLFPGENHELSRAGSPFHRKQRAEIILDFFGRYLQGDSAPDS